MKKFNFFIKFSLSQKLIMGFMIAIIVGTLILMLPVATTSSQGLGFTKALFTIASAICVTGLSVIDVSKELTNFGQMVLLIFIQLGGLGIMTFSSFIFMLIGKKITYEERELLKEERNVEDNGGIIGFLRKVILTVFSIEIIGAIFLTIGFLKEMPLKTAVYFGIFHSISAFCNAGFSLFTNGLEGYSSDFLINMTIAYLIIIGGIGFAVINSIVYSVRYKRNKLDLTSKVAVTITTILTVIGMFFFFVFEYRNNGTIGNMPLRQKMLASFFQSVTTRTAGFNTVPIGNLTESSILMFCMLMFVGASPGSTGGGIKTTTMGVIIFYVIGVIRKKEKISIFNRRIGWEILNRAITILVLAIAYILTITLIILSIENITFNQAIFEVVSAFGTVGLTLGVTSDLGTVSRLLIIITMFIGRLGPMTFAIAFGGTNKIEKISFPKENIIVG
ncbi:MAG: TrkH family potassium uptake protein [Fusobacterium sp.]